MTVEIAVSQLARHATLALLVSAAATLSTTPSAGADRGWMTESAMRTAFIGKTLDGHYVDGLEWTETYEPGGRLDYKEPVRAGVGHWYFRGKVFCTLYDPGQGLNGGCFTTIQESANCYEFYVASLSGRQTDEDVEPGPAGRWVARAWRRSEPSTCEPRPSV